VSKLTRHLLIVSVVTTVVSLSVLGSFTNTLGVSLLDSPDKMAEVFGLGDSGSYLKAALELSQLDGLTQDKHWVINLWPPGMVLLNGFLIEFFGGAFAIAYSLLLILLWSTFVSIFAVKVEALWGLNAALLSSVLILLSGPFQFWIFNRGLFYAEGFSQLFYLIGLIALIEGSRAKSYGNSISYGVLAGVFLSLAAYFRASFSILEPLLFVGALLVLTTWVLLSLLRIEQKAHLSRLFAVLSSAWVSIYLLMEPWLRFTAEEIRGVRSWSVVGEGFLRGVWIQRDEQAGFLSAGGIGWGCEINAAFCSKVLEQQTETGVPYPINEITSEIVNTVISSPVAYFADRWHFLLSGWFSVDSSMGAAAWGFGMVSLLAFLLVHYSHVRQAVAGEYIHWFVLLIVIILTIPQMIGHIEPRYFIPLKLLIFIYPWVVSTKTRFAGMQNTKID